MSERSVVLHAVGDIMIGDHPLNAGRGAHSTFRSRPADFPFAHVASALGRADLAFGNLECTLSEHGLRPGDHRSMQLRGQISYAEALRHAGFSVLCVANNHSMQHGRQSFLETVDALRNAGVAVCGLAGTSYRTVVPEVLERNGLRIVFLGWSLRPRGYFASDPLYAEGYTADMLNDVRTARERHDCVVVTLHWGDEFVERPSPAEVEFAHDVMDAGADLLIGHQRDTTGNVRPDGEVFAYHAVKVFKRDLGRLVDRRAGFSPHQIAGAGSAGGDGHCDTNIRRSLSIHPRMIRNRKA